MPAPLSARISFGEERTTIDQLARSRTAPARTVERARIVLLSRNGDSVEEIVAVLGVCPATVRLGVNRFHREGVKGLADRSRSGRPATYSAEQIGEVIATSLTDPQTLDLPFASWTLDRLTTYLNEEKGLAIKRSRISELLSAEGLRWRDQETWFGERVDPAFAEKRGRSSRSTPRRRRTAS